MTDARDLIAVRARISVSGRVQGVGYRAFTVRAAVERGLVGGVKNCEDGRVELEVEGPKENIMSLIAALKAGPPAARGQWTNFAVWY
jgi:acylphosphatase